MECFFWIGRGVLVREALGYCNPRLRRILREDLEEAGTLGDFEPGFRAACLGLFSCSACRENWRVGVRGIPPFARKKRRMGHARGVFSS